jgi:hypothetical protein
MVSPMYCSTAEVVQYHMSTAVEGIKCSFNKVTVVCYWQTLWLVITDVLAAIWQTTDQEASQESCQYPLGNLTTGSEYTNTL